MPLTQLLIPGGFNASNKVRIHYDSATNEAGLQIKLTNKTGGVTSKGYLVSPSAGTDRAFGYTALDDPDPMGVVYEAGIADGSECWVWNKGIVKVYFIGATTRKHLARMSLTLEGGVIGQAKSEAVPTSPFATDKHFQESGHVLEAIGGAGLALVDFHCN